MSRNFVRTVVSLAFGLALIVPTAARAQEDLRPVGKSIGVGAGWVFPADVLEPNTASLRFRVTDKLTLEGLFGLGLGGGSALTEIGSEEFEDKISTFNFALGAEARYAFASAGPVDLVGLAGLQFATGSQETDPEGADNLVTTSSSGFGVNWGVGVEWFLGRHVALSADAVNMLIDYGSVTQEQQDEYKETESTFNAGLFLNPTVRLMFHVWF